MISVPLATELTASPHETILEAARDLIAEGGIEAMSMRAVAERVGVSATAIYHHYANKQALVDAVVRLAFERFGAEMQAAADRHPRGSLQRVRALGEAYARFALEHEASFRIIFSIAAPTLRDIDELPAGAATPSCARPSWTPWRPARCVRAIRTSWRTFCGRMSTAS